VHSDGCPAKAIRLVGEYAGEYPTQWAAIKAVSGRLGMSTQTRFLPEAAPGSCSSCCATPKESSPLEPGSCAVTARRVVAPVAAGERMSLATVDGSSTVSPATPDHDGKPHALSLIGPVQVSAVGPFQVGDEPLGGGRLGGGAGSGLLEVVQGGAGTQHGVTDPAVTGE